MATGAGGGGVAWTAALRGVGVFPPPLAHPSAMYFRGAAPSSRLCPGTAALARSVLPRPGG